MHCLQKYFRIVAACRGVALASPLQAMAAESYAAEPRAVVDVTGARVRLPPAINRIIITCYGGASHEIALLGGANKIIAQPTMARFTQLYRIYKNLADVPDAGSFNNANIEYILTLKPDLVFAGIVSTQANQRIKALGIPVVVLGIGRHDIRSLFSEFKMMGRILDSESLADELIAYWRDKLSQIDRLMASAPGLKKKKVFYGSSGFPFRTEGGLWWGHQFIESSGGINAARGLKNRGTVSNEQLLVWNPDVIVVSTNKDRPNRVEDILKNPKLQGINAVKKRAVYSCPLGTFWWDRPSPEAILGFLWLAKTLYPETMAEINIKEETQRFYAKFYRYQLADTEYEAFFGQR
jgi:iron complex transport system substrate-binding protein